MKELGPNALQKLCAIFNYSFLQADLPQIWQAAIIIILLKAGKPESEVASFYLVSLTSYVAKHLPQIIADRFFVMAEYSILFS